MRYTSDSRKDITNWVVITTLGSLAARCNLRIIGVRDSYCDARRLAYQYGIDLIRDSNSELKPGEKLDISRNASGGLNVHRRRFTELFDIDSDILYDDYVRIIIEPVLEFNRKELCCKER